LHFTFFIISFTKQRKPVDMKKVLFLLSIFMIFSCSDDDKHTPMPDSVWAHNYPWLGEIMQKAEMEKFKDGSGKKAMVTIRVAELDQQHYFTFHYGQTGLIHDEMRDDSGLIITEDQEREFLNLNFQMIYPLDETEMNIP